MTKLPHRSGATWLTDDDLLLLDFLFDKPADPWFLRASVYPTHMNCRRTHCLDDEQLFVRLSELERFGIVKKRQVDLHRIPFVYELTPCGGRLWEEERQPDWSRYVEDSWRPLGYRNRELASVLAYSQDALEKFVDSAARHHYWEPTDSQRRVRHRRFRTSRLLPWRGVKEIVSACIWIRGEYHGQPSIDWKAMAKEATWWRSVDDWNTLRSQQK